MRSVQRLVLGMALIVAATSAHGAATTARLVLSHEAARPGDTVWAGLSLQMAPQWHTYWENGGDSGAPTKLDWALPAGVTAGGILWPVPEKLLTAGLITYVYESTVVLLVPLSIATNAPTGALELKALASWLECASICVAGSNLVSAKLTVGATAKTSADAALIESWRKKLPQPKPASFARARWEKPVGGETRPLLIEWTAISAAKAVDFYPSTSTNGTVRTATESLSATPGKVRVEVEKGDNGWPKEIAGLLIEKNESGAVSAALSVNMAVEESSTPASVGQAAGQNKALVAWLGLAFLGGLILNLMPCVLPVIALKILGFVNQSRESPARVRKLGVVYALGVVASFLVLAGVVIGLKSVGRQVSWGMQFGDARFLIIMTTLATLVALNLFGLFEVTLGGSAMGAASELAAREGVSGAFFNGVLATALATPCTAPALASALGFAFAQPSGIIVLMFVTVALGLAAPYVALSFHPAWLKFLPKPGAWMERFRTAMGFPMLATAVWLFTLTNDYYGDVLWLGFFLVTLALAAWVYGQFVQRGRSRQGLALGICVALVAVGYGYGLEKELRWRTPPPPKPAGVAEEIIQEGPDGIQWHRWSPAMVQKARSEGR